MGLFGVSPEKKLEKADRFLADGRIFDAWKNYEDVLRSRDADAAIAERARSGSLSARSLMIEERLGEAEQLRVIGDFETARDRCQTALDLARNDLDRSAIDEKIRLLESPKRPTSRTGRPEEDVVTDLLPAPDEANTLPEVSSWWRPEAPEPIDAESAILPEEIELHLAALDPSVEAHYRSLGESFLVAWASLSAGQSEEALRRLESVTPPASLDPWVQIEQAHALLLVHRAEEAHARLSATPEVLPGDSEPSSATGLGAHYSAKRRYLLVEVLRTLHLEGDAVLAAEALYREVGDQSPAVVSAYAWTLIEAGRHDEAYRLLQPQLQSAALLEEILVPLAQSTALLGRREEAIDLLEGLIQARFHRSLQRETEVDFPIEAGRRLLEFYIEDEDPESPELHSLLQHLLDQDRERGEHYRDLLLRMAAGRSLRD